MPALEAGWGVGFLCVCVWGGGRERLVLLRVHQSPGVHFSLDSGSSYFRASLGQLGADQKPQAEETLALRVSAKGGGDAQSCACPAAMMIAALQARHREGRGHLCAAPKGRATAYPEL